MSVLRKFWFLFSITIDLIGHLILFLANILRVFGLEWLADVVENLACAFFSISERGFINGSKQ